jgi:ribonuclease VapC
VIDSSAIVAVFRGEPGADELFARAMRYQRRVMSASTWLECATVCEGKKDEGGGERFDRIASTLKLEVVAFSPQQAIFAREAFRRYGKGRQTKASLSFGDCFAYALAKDLGAPLLFKGNDFAQTDIAAA